MLQANVELNGSENTTSQTDRTHERCCRQCHHRRHANQGLLDRRLGCPRLRVPLLWGTRSMLGRKVVVRWMFSFGGFYQDDLRYYTIRVHCYSLWNHRGTQSLVWKRGRANHTPLPLTTRNWAGSRCMLRSSIYLLVDTSCSLWGRFQQQAS